MPFLSGVHLSYRLTLVNCVQTLKANRFLLVREKTTTVGALSEGAEQGSVIAYVNFRFTMCGACNSAGFTALLFTELLFTEFMEHRISTEFMELTFRQECAAPVPLSFMPLLRV